MRIRGGVNTVTGYEAFHAPECKLLRKKNKQKTKQKKTRTHVRYVQKTSGEVCMWAKPFACTSGCSASQDTEKFSETICHQRSSQKSLISQDCGCPECFPGCACFRAWLWDHAAQPVVWWCARVSSLSPLPPSQRVGVDPDLPLSLVVLMFKKVKTGSSVRSLAAPCLSGRRRLSHMAYFCVHSLASLLYLQGGKTEKEIYINHIRHAVIGN